MNSISQLDLLSLGKRGLPQRIGLLEGQQRQLAIAATSAVPTQADPAIRPNLFLNSSFEFYNKNAVLPDKWTFSGGTSQLSYGTTGADGINSVIINGSSVAQLAADGATVPYSAVVVSVAVRTLNAGQTLSIALTHSPGITAGEHFYLDADGHEVAGNLIPNDGLWYRLYRSFVLVGGAPVLAYFTHSGGSTIEIDAAKFEKVDGVNDYLQPTSYVTADWGAATQIRNLAADNIVAGTLTVGGSNSNNPRISVKDGADIEIVSIGNPNGGFYGIEVKGTAGIKVSGTGSVSVLGGGSITVAGGGNIIVTGGGGINVTNGSVTLSGAGEVVVSGTGRVRAGPTAGNRAELTAGGLALYNADGAQNVLLSSLTGKVHLFGDATEFGPNGKLTVVSGLVWADATGFYAMDSAGLAAFAVVGVDGKNWGGGPLDKGDILIGRDSNYVWWDSSANLLHISGEGSGITSINGGNIVTGSVTAPKLSSDAIDGKVITGATIRTAASGQRVELALSGMKSYKADGTTRVSFDSNGITGGNVTLNESGITIYTAGNYYTETNTITFKSAAGSVVGALSGAYDNASFSSFPNPARETLFLTSRGKISIQAGTSLVDPLYLIVNPIPGTTGYGWTLGGTLLSNSDIKAASFSGDTVTVTGTGRVIFPNGYLTTDPNVYGKGEAGITTVGVIGTASAIRCGNWFRSQGASGWTNETYGGGWFMSDSNYIRNSGKIPVYITGADLGTGQYSSSTTQMLVATAGNTMSLRTDLFRHTAGSSWNNVDFAMIRRVDGTDQGYLVFGGSSNGKHFGLNTFNPSNVLTLPNSADIEGRGIANRWDSYSSARWKTDVVTIDGSWALDAIDAFRGVTYTPTVGSFGPQERQYGFIAEEAGAVVSELVTWETNGVDAQSLAYDRFSSIHNEGIKELNRIRKQHAETIAAQGRTIKKQTQVIEDLVRRLEVLESRLNEE